jgi:hypothetical protein
MHETEPANPPPPPAPTGKPAPPVRPLADLLAESKRLERRGRALIQRARAVVAEIAEARERELQQGKPKE